MNLQIIQASIADYEGFLKSKRNRRYLYAWESLQFFNKNWDTEATDLYSAYDAALDNSESRRQWKADDFFPKEMMLKFIKLQPEYVRLAFRDLFNESISLSTRVDRFIFYCDELLTMYKEANPTSVENNHYHNHAVVMMYLTGRFPEKYTLYDREDFHGFLSMTNAKNIPVSNDMDRFEKVVKILNTFLGKNPKIRELSQGRLEDKHYQEENRLHVFEFLKVVVRNAQLKS